MSIEFESVVDHPLDDVYAWHTRPGAMRRLVPPWQPMTVIAETESLADGRAVLGLPGGLRWVAQHIPAEFDPPHRFVDVLATDGPASWPPRVLGGWRHTHEFVAQGSGTRVYDRIDAVVPAAALRPMFVYRHTQLAEDLAAHRAAGLSPMVVAVTGAGGLVGDALTAFLSAGGHRVIRLARGSTAEPDARQWNPDDPAADLLAGVDVVVHLAGASIAGRFTDAHRAAIRDSRIGPTRALAEAAAQADDGPHTFISASAIGFYGYARGDSQLTEDSTSGDGFLADVVADREAATEPARAAGLRVVNVRTGVVQSARGGTLRLLRPLFAAGLGGRLGSGTQWLSWIGLDDLLDVYHRALRHPPDGSGERGLAGTGAQHRIHRRAGSGAAPADAAAGAVLRAATTVGSARGARTRRSRSAGAARQADRSGSHVPTPRYRRRTGSRTGTRLTRGMRQEPAHQKPDAPCRVIV